jgi:excisionase family DNA binding protein
MNSNNEISEVEQPHRARRRAMSIAEFCERYGPGRTTVYDQIKRGLLRARKCGKRTIIIEDDAEAWLKCLPIVADRGLVPAKRA